MPKIITKEDVEAACEKAADKATKAETKRCVAAAKDAYNGTDPTTAEKKAVKVVIAAIKDGI